MKALKIILIIIVVILALFLLLAAFLPSEYRVERSTVIDKPVDVVYGFVVDFGNRAKWDPWMEMEPEAESVFDVKEGFIGSSWYWEGEKLGTGRLTVEDVVDNESIRSKLEFLSPQQMESDVYWDFQATEGETEVSWATGGTLRYPLERYFGLMMDKMMGSDLERGLSNLKREIESLE